MIRNLFSKLIVPRLAKKVSEQELEKIKAINIQINFIDINSILSNSDTDDIRQKDNMTIVFSVEAEKSNHTFFIRVTKEKAYVSNEYFSILEYTKNKKINVTALIHYNMMSAEEIEKAKEEILKKVRESKFKFDEESFLEAIDEIYKKEGISSIRLEFIDCYNMTFVCVRGVAESIIVFGTEFFCKKNKFIVNGLDYFDFYLLAKNRSGELARKLVLTYMETKKIEFDYFMYRDITHIFEDYVRGEITAENVEAEINMLLLQKI